ncbi:MAG: hypothetical protein ACHQ52_01700, partial [Candidatus Eisenbacteria bacterium]
MLGPRRWWMAAFAAGVLSIVVLIAVIAIPVTRSVTRRMTTCMLANVVVSEASAQTRLDFKPVPAESAEAFDQHNAVHRTARGSGTLKAVPASPPPPVHPDAVQNESPDVPEPPEPATPSSTGNIVQIGSDIHIEKGQVVDGDVLSIGGDIRVDGHVRGNVSA